MSILDSPFDFCPHVKDYVLLDQTLCECRSEHGCTLDRCPLGNGFVGIDFHAAKPAVPAPAKARRRR